MLHRSSIYITTPLGILEISGTNTYITSVQFVEDEAEASETIPDVLLQCQTELGDYFTGKRTTFNVALKPEGTSFQKKVWGELKKIEYGATVSYSTIAKKLKNPDAVRAVGLANGKNPIAIILPCHRVIGEN